MQFQLFVRRNGALRAVDAHPEDTVASMSGLSCAEAAPGAQAGALRVVYGGRTLDPRDSLAAAGVSGGGCPTLELLPRLRGGGGDGGSTGAESRSSYLEMYAGKKKDKADPEEERLARWTTCQLSGMPLQPPCVADHLGSLFNKDAVLQALVTKSMPKPLGHIGGLKHVVDLRLEPGPAGNGSSSGGGGGDGPGIKFACPITGQAFNGKAKFVVLCKSGHVLSERAIKEVPGVVEELVGSKWAAADLLPVNPAGEQLQQMREQLLLKRTAERAAKQEKKKSKSSTAAANGGAGAAADATAGAVAAAVGGKRGGDHSVAAAAGAANGGGPTPAPTAAAAAAKRFKAKELKPKNADDAVWNSLFTSSTKDGGQSNEYMCRGSSRYVA